MNPSVIRSGLLVFVAALAVAVSGCETTNPYWQITQPGTAESVQWVDAANPRFAIYDSKGDSTGDTATWVDDYVLDRETGLVWERAPDETDRNWWQAYDHCITLHLHTDGNRRPGWRLPTVEERASLAYDTEYYGTSPPALEPGHPFHVEPGPNDWTATTYNDRYGLTPGLGAYYVRRWNGFIHHNAKQFANDGGIKYRAWCVRGGYGHDGY